MMCNSRLTLRKTPDLGRFNDVRCLRPTSLAVVSVLRSCDGAVSFDAICLKCAACDTLIEHVFWSCNTPSL